MSSALTDRSTGARLVAIVCTAQVFVQIGAFYWPALLPQMMRHWSLSNSEAGWITSSFYAAYMLSVPVLVTLTDRIDAKRVYLFGVGCTLVAHLAFGLLADGFWSAYFQSPMGRSGFVRRTRNDSRGRDRRDYGRRAAAESGCEPEPLDSGLRPRVDLWSGIPA